MPPGALELLKIVTQQKYPDFIWLLEDTLVPSQIINKIFNYIFYHKNHTLAYNSLLLLFVCLCRHYCVVVIIVSYLAISESQLLLYFVTYCFLLCSIRSIKCVCVQCIVLWIINVVLKFIIIISIAHTLVTT